ncbi:MAG TPA: HAMP domain-containing sensor histidine kinase [Actinomycetota bacterium]
MTLRRQLVVVFAVFAAALVTATIVPLGVASSRANLASFVEQRVAQALRVADSVARAPNTINERYPRSSGDAAWLIGGSSTGPTRSEAFPEGEPAGAEIDAARAGSPEHRFGESPLGRRLFMAAPVQQLDRILWVSASLDPVERLNRETWLIAIGIGALTMAVAVVVGATLAARITRRLESVAEGASRLGEGRWDAAIPVEGPDEIAALAARLNEMGSEIGRLLRREKDFVAAASHQLRTPLAAIKIRIDEIRALDAVTDPQALQDLDEMSEEVDRLTALTRRLLDLSATESRPEPRPLPVAQAVREALGRVLPLAELRRIALRFEGEPSEAVLAAPAGAFEEVLFNVLDNAVKFSSSGTDVLVSVSGTGDTVVIDVADRGPGIPDDDRERVFAPFYRGARKEPGHGLGLAIGARLCARSSATLKLDPRPGGGTVARIEWPAWRWPPGPDPA